MLCFDCANRLASRSLPLVADDDVPDVPELVDGVCPVCGGTRGLDPEDAG